MKITNWFRNGSIDVFHQFCNQNRGNLVSTELSDSTESIRGILYNYSLWTIDADGIFLLLTNRAMHRAFYSIDDIESLVFLGPASLMHTAHPSTQGCQRCALHDMIDIINRLEGA